MTVLTYSNVVAKYMSGVTLDLDFTSMSSLDSRVTFSRASLGTYFDSAGVLCYAGHNFWQQSQTFDHVAWGKTNGATVTADNTTAPDSTTTADRLNHVTAGTVTGGRINQNYTAAPYRHIVSVYAKAGSKNWLAILEAATSKSCWFNLSAGVVGTVGTPGMVSSGIQSMGSGWYRCWALCSTASSAAHLCVAEADNTLTCTSPGDIYLWGAQVEYVTTATTPSTYLPTTTAAAHGPRLDYDPVTHVAKGLLIEEARTNQAQGSQDFTNVNWTKTGITVTADQITAPDGTTTADLMTASATPATVSNIAAVVAAAPWTLSVFAKKGTSNWFYLCALATGTGAQTPKAYFNLNTGVVGTVEALITASSIQDVGNGWYRCSITSLGTAGTESWQAGICDADNNAAVTVGRTIYLWGAQNEVVAAPFASSYLPTAPAASATRAADIATMTGSNFSSWYNEPAGTFVAEFDLFSTAGNRSVIEVDNNTTNEQIWLANSAGQARTFVVDGGANQLPAVNIGSTVAGSVYKLGLSFALNDFASCLNGGTVTLDTAGTLPTPTQMRIGWEVNASNTLNGHVRRIRFWNYAQSDAALQAATT